MKKVARKAFGVRAPKTGDKSPSSHHKATTLAHLLHTAANQLGHTKTHHVSMGKPSNSPKGKQLDYEHSGTHLDGGIEHIQKAIDHVRANYPAEARELKKLEKAIPTSSGSFRQSLRKARGR